MSLIGNAVGFGDRPSAVIGNEICIMPLFGLKPSGKAQWLGWSESQKTCLS